MTEDVEQHDLSRLDAYACSRQKVAFLNAVWRPMAAGAVGAALVIGAIWVVLPKISVREVVVDHVNVVPREVEVPKVTMRDVTADHVVVTSVPVEVPKITVKNLPVEVPKITITPVPVDVPKITVKDVPIELPRVVTPPSPAAADRPLTPDESRFAAKPEFQDAPYHGRIVESRGGGALSFEDGRDFFPAHADPATGKTVMDPQNAFDADQFVGDLGLCRPDQGLWRCVALHRGRETPVAYKRGRPA